MSLGLSQEQEKESNIMTKLLGVIAIAAVAFAVAPAQAAKHAAGGCSSTMSTATSSIRPLPFNPATSRTRETRAVKSSMIQA